MELKGKIVAFLGDSITQGIGVSDCVNSRYDRILLREEGLAEAINYGISGTRFAYQRMPSPTASFDLYFCGRACMIDPRADIIVVFGGVNDYLHGDAPVGSPEDHIPTSFYGAAWSLMNTLRTNYVGKTVVFMTPAHAYGYGDVDTTPSPNPNKLPDALPLLEYVDIIKERAREFEIPVLDLYRTLGINPCEEADRVAYAPDGVHFNEAGHAVIAAKLAEFLKAL